MNEVSPRRKALRYAVYALMIVCAVAWQGAGVGRLTGFCYILPLPIVISIAAFEFEIVGLGVGILAGALWDLASPMLSGIHALFCALAAVAVGFFIRYYLRNNIRSFLLFDIALVFIALVARYFASFGFARAAAGLPYIFRAYLPSLIITVIFSVAAYIAVGLVHTVTSRPLKGRV